MNDFEEGSVVICLTSQAGTIIQLTSQDVWVLLANKDVWVGPIRAIRFPQDQADLDACPLNVQRIEEKRSIRQNSD
jgi:hypothetical protein